jgi:hypothetical protein
MFMLVRDGQSAKYFICPSENGTTECTSIKNTGGAYYWDFEGPGSTTNTAAIQVSYGYQCPLVGGTSATNGVNSAYPSAVILADKSSDPNTLSATPNTDTTFSLAAYASGMSTEDTKKYMSPNHTAGEYINFLRADYSVGNSKRPDCGYNSGLGTASTPNGADYIYTASGNAFSATAGAGAQYGGTAAIASHLNAADSYIVGPRAK